MTEQESLITSDERDIPIEFVNMQIQQALETYRSYLSTFVQVMTVMAVANVTIIGYALSAKIASLFFIGTIFPVMILYFIYLLNKGLVPILHTAMSLESQYGGSGKEWLASTLVSVVGQGETRKLTDDIYHVEDPNERIVILRNSNIRLIGTGKGIMRGALVVIAVGQVLASIALTLFFNWEFI